MLKAPVAHDGYGRVAKRLLRWALVCAAAVGTLCVGSSAPMTLMMLIGEGDQKSDRARLDVGNLHHALKAYRARKGGWPPKDRWSEVLVAAQILKQFPLDPWDRPYQYRLEATDGGEGQPVVTSLGRDGVADTDDDLPSRTSLPDGT